MIQSMTGYGKAAITLKNINFTIDIKSLNSKQIDVSIKMPSTYRDKEIELRQLLAEKLQRGKIEFFILRESSASNLKYTFNTAIIEQYYKQIVVLKKRLGLRWNWWTFSPFKVNSTDIFPVLLKMPDVIQKEQNKANKSEWEDIQTGINDAISGVLQFRIEEGKKLEKDICKRIDIIIQHLERILPLAEKRIEKVKHDLEHKLKALESQKSDANRLEEELFYYLEKQDITEEQVRLDAHIKYFIKTIKTEFPNGKKLAFIVQEMGREINTIGSKSSDADMQHIVVQMKDELEKIKEQLFNIL